MGQIKDITGLTFGRLTVIEFAGFGSSHKTLWKCKCDCGNDPLYGVWLNIRDRCNNPNNSHYKYYGEKGIKLCDEWNNFQNFYDWAYSNGYTKKDYQSKE